MNILGYIVYGIGALIILAFLWSAIQKQHKESVHTDEETCEPAFENTQDVQLYENGPERDTLPSTDSKQSIKPMIVTLNKATITTTKTVAPSDFTSNATPLKEPLSESLTLHKKPAPIQAEQHHIKSGYGDDMPTHIIGIHVVAPRGRAFYGSTILTVADQHHLVYSDKGLYQSIDQYSEVLFSIASALEPGTFDLSFMDKYTTPGLVFFVDLKHTASPKVAFKKMLTCAYEIAKELNGDLLDHRRQRLTESSVVEYLAQIKGVESSRAFI